MKGELITSNKPVTAELKFRVHEPTRIYVIVRDADNPSEEYTNRFKTIKNGESLFVRMPISPKRAEILIHDESMMGGGEPKFELVKVKKHDLKSKRSDIVKKNKDAENFVEFAEEFIVKLPSLSSNGSVYASDNGKFRIHVMDEIVDQKGKVLATPARISKNNGRIELSKNKFLSYTIPMRMAILLHEMSHFYVNKVSSDETEADLNALDIYLNAGYPRIEALSVFTDVFHTSPSAQNIQRYEVLKKFVTNFEKDNKQLNYIG